MRREEGWRPEFEVMKGRDFVRNQVLERRTLRELEEALNDEASISRPGVLRQIRQELLGRLDGRTLADKAARLSIRLAAEEGDYAEIFAALEAVSEGDDLAWSVGAITTALVDGSRLELSACFTDSRRLRNPIVEKAFLLYVSSQYFQVVASDFSQVASPTLMLLLEALRKKSLEKLRMQFEICFKSEHRFKED